MKLLINLSIPEPQPQQPAEPQNPQEQKCSLEDNVRELLDLIESGHESIVEWRVINRLYSDLQSPKYKNNPKAQNIREMIEPILAKNGFHKVPQGAH
jgi:hypothetical protein